MSKDKVIRTYTLREIAEAERYRQEFEGRKYEIYKQNIAYKAMKEAEARLG